MPRLGVQQPQPGALLPQPLGVFLDQLGVVLDLLGFSRDPLAVSPHPQDFFLELFHPPFVLHLALLVAGIPMPVERRAQVARGIARTQ